MISSVSSSMRAFESWTGVPPRLTTPASSWSSYPSSYGSPSSASMPSSSGSALACGSESMSGWNVYTSQSAMFMIASSTDERLEGRAPKPAALCAPPAADSAPLRASPARGECAGKLLSMSGSSSELAREPTLCGEPTAPLRRLSSVEVRLLSTSAGLPSRVKSPGFTSLKSWSGNAPLSVAIRRNRVLRADGWSSRPNGEESASSRYAGGEVDAESM